MTAINPTAARWNVTRQQYHADRECLSNSALGDFLKSPALYHGRHITGIYPREKSTAFDTGTVAHQLILEPDADLSYAIIPRDALNSDGHRKGAAWKAFESENVGKVLLKSDEFEPIGRMVRSVREHPRANSLLFGDGGERELPIRWECDRHGILRRSLIDLLRPVAIVDLKTTTDASAEGFASSAWKFRYMNQVAYYKDAVHALTGEWLPFVFVVIEKDPPYRCECYELDQEFEEQGYNRINSGIERLKACRESGKWETPTHGTIVQIAAPRWSKYADDYSYTA